MQIRLQLGFFGQRFADALLLDVAVAADHFGKPRQANEDRNLRRAEQIRQQTCAKKADNEKVMPRERTAFLSNCLEIELAKQADGAKP